MGASEYDAFGTRRAPTGIQYRFGFTGEQRDAETGFIYLRARYYEPAVGRFVSKDSFTGFLDDPESLNRFVYVENLPTLYVDPSGLRKGGAGIGGGGGGGGGVTTLPQPTTPQVPVGKAAGNAAAAIVVAASTYSACGYVVRKIRGEDDNFKGGKQGERENWWGYNDKNFRRWYHREWKEDGDDDATKEEMTKAWDEWNQRGRPKYNKKWD